MSAHYFQTSLGLDFHDDSIAMTMIKNSVSKIGVVDGSYIEMSPLKFLSDPELESRFIQEVKAFLNRKNYRPKFVCLSLPRSLFFFESFEVPVPAEHKFLHSMIEFELEKHLSSGLKYFYFGYHLNLLKNNQYRVTASGLKKETVAYYLQLIKRLGLAPYLLTTPTIANANLVLAEKSDSFGLTAMVDLGPRNMEISILKNGLIEFSRSQPLMDRSFAQAYFLEIEDNELMRTRSYGIAKEIIAKIEEGLAQSKYVEEQESLNKVYLLGGGALASQVAKYLQNESGVQTTFPCKPPEIDPHFPKEYQIAYLNTSLGLACHPFRENALYVNLLPSSLKPKEKKSGFGGALVLTALALLAYLALLGYQILLNNKQIADLDGQLEAVKNQAVALQAIDLQHEQLKKSMAVFQVVENKYPQKLSILNELSNLLPKNTWLTGMRFKGNRLEINGISTSASELVPILEKSPMLEKVTFSGAILKEGKREKFSIHMFVRNSTG
jgi:Tfp pilus assembly protein PilN/Tfp pilus assembly PilM family ATPase